MLGVGLLVLCAYALLVNIALGQPLPCNGNNYQTINVANLRNNNCNCNPGLGTNGNIGIVDNIGIANGIGNTDIGNNAAINSCNNIGAIGSVGNLNPLGNGNIINVGNIGQSPLTITSAKFTPVSNALANQIGLQGPIISEVVPNLQFGDVTLSGDLPIGGTIKVCGCFPVYGMVAVDGIVPSSGTAVVQNGCQFPAQIVQGVQGSCGC